MDESEFDVENVDGKTKTEEKSKILADKNKNNSSSNSTKETDPTNDDSVDARYKGKKDDSKKSEEEQNSKTDTIDARTKGTGGIDCPDIRLASAFQKMSLGKGAVKTEPPKLEAYNFSHARRGKAIIINQRDFNPDSKMSTRHGTDRDAEGLIESLLELEFDVEKYDNLTVNQMHRVLRNAALQDHSDSDCFACAILTHGEEGKVYGRDGTILIDELTAPFKGKESPTLIGKPKLFFIQACRGNMLDHGVPVDATDADEVDANQTYRIPAEADFLMAYSVVPGYFSWRNSARGSWFVQALCDVLTEYGTSLDILSLMTRVNRKVAYEFESNAAKEFMNKKKQIPCIVSMLTKDLYFTPKRKN